MKNALFLPALILTLALNLFTPASRAALTCAGVYQKASKQSLMIQQATALGLHYLSPLPKGIRRERAEQGFIYFDPTGTPISDPGVIRRIEAIGIPPAHEDVWISTDPMSHLQAIGSDSKGRRQYRYHERWTEVRNSLKFARMIEFGDALPQVRSAVARDLLQAGFTQSKILATVVRLLERTLIRVGNEEYAKDNESYGLTTMLKSHVQIQGSKVVFTFRGKSGVSHEKTLDDSSVAAWVTELLTLPGDNLFQYLDDKGQPRTVDSNEVNRYIKQTSGREFSAKDFRTWMGTVYAADYLYRAGEVGDPATRQQKISKAIEFVASKLGNTPAVSRESYVDPRVLALYEAQGPFFRAFAAALSAKSSGTNATGRNLTEEATLLMLIPLTTTASDSN